MRINEIILEDSQLDELSALGAGQGIGRVGGNIVRGTKDFFSGIKQGYQQARNPAGGQPGTPGTTPASGQSAPTASSGSTPTTNQAASAAPSSSAPTSGQTNTPTTSTGAPQSSTSQQPAANQAAPASKPATINAATVAPNIDAMKKAYTNLDPAEREKLKSELEIIDDHERLATGTNENLDDLLKLSGI